MIKNLFDPFNAAECRTSRKELSTMKFWVSICNVQSLDSKLITLNSLFFKSPEFLLERMLIEIQIETKPNEYYSFNEYIH